MEREEHLVCLLQQLKEGQNMEEVQQGIEEIKEIPDISLVFSNVILQTTDLSMEKAAATIYLTYIRERYETIPPEVQEELGNALIMIFRKVTNWENQVILAEIVRIVFQGKIFWKEMLAFIVELYRSKITPTAILLLNKIIQPMEAGTIHQLWEGLRNIALAGLVNPSNAVKFLAVDIFFEIYKLEEDVEILIPVNNMLLNLLDSYKELDSNDYSTVWSHYIKSILKLKNLDEETIMEFLTAAAAEIEDETVDCFLRISVISALTNVIPKMTQEIIEQFITASFALGMQYIAEHEEDVQQLSDVVEFIESALQLRLEFSAPLVIAGFKELVQSEEGAAQTLSVYIIGLLLQYAPNEVVEDMEFLQTTLNQALQSDQELLITAALSAIEMLEDEETQAASISRGLMENVLPYLTSESPEIRMLSFHAMQSLCELCDSPVEGLFSTVWAIHTEGNLQEENIDNYLSLLSQVIELSDDFSDEFVDSILQFANELISDKPETTKAAALSIISVLMEHDDTVPSKVPNICEVLEALLQYENEDVIVSALGFIRNTASTLREPSLEIIGPFLEQINTFLQKETGISAPKVFSKALSTSSVIIKYTHNTDLLESVCEIIKSFFEDPEVEVLKDACESLNLISKELRPIDAPEFEEQNEINNQRSHYFFDKLIQTVDEEIDVEVLDFAFDALRHIYKYCKAFDEEYFNTQCGEIIQKIVEGDINYCAGTVPQEMEFQSELVKSVMYLFYQFIISQEEMPEELLQFSLVWMTSRQEAIDSILGTLSDIITIKPIAEELIGQILEFAKEKVETTDPLLQHNMTTFLTRVARVYPQMMESISEFVPAVDSWWENGESKDGFSETLSNFASFYLLIDADDERNARALKMYPPADVTESVFMTETLLQFVQAKERPAEIILLCAFGAADLLTESVSISQKRKIPEEMKGSLIEMLKSFIQQDQTIYPAILEHLSASQKKREDISALLGIQ